MGSRDHSPSDRRRFFRESVYGGAVVHVDGVALRGQITNLSLGGALISLGEHVPHKPGLNHDVRIELEIGGHGWITQRARVRRATAREVAVAFTEIKPNVEDVIEDELLAAVEARNRPRVVVVDAEPHRRRRVSEQLHAAGCISLEAATPLEAIAMVEEPRNHVAAIAVADTVRDAHPLVAYLTDSNPGIPIAMLAEDANTDDARSRSASRARTEDELTNAITEHVRRRTP